MIWAGLRCGCLCGLGVGRRYDRGSFLSGGASICTPSEGGNNSRMGRGSLPFYRLSLKATKPLPPEYPKELKTLGNHIRKSRLNQGLTQRQVAGIIGVNKGTIGNWEIGVTQPAVHCISKIIDFLGYAPYCPPKSLGERLIQARKSLGLTQKQLAKILGVDPTSIRDWECGVHKPVKKSLKIIQKFFLEHA